MVMKKGFTLIELMIVVAIIAFLSMLAVPNLLSYLAKAKRAEAYAQLASLAMAQKAYFAEHGTYSQVLSGPQGLNWKPQGLFHYTYGFPGQEGVNYYTGTLKAPSSALEKSYVSAKGFLAVAAGDIDGDGLFDIIGIDHNHMVTVFSDDLA